MCEKADRDSVTATSASPGTGACSCGPGWLALGSADTGSCYKVSIGTQTILSVILNYIFHKRGESEAGVTWAEARAACQVGLHTWIHSDTGIIHLFSLFMPKLILQV